MTVLCSESACQQALRSEATSIKSTVRKKKNHVGNASRDWELLIKCVRKLFEVPRELAKMSDPGRWLSGFQLGGSGWSREAEEKKAWR